MDRDCLADLAPEEREEFTTEEYEAFKAAEASVASAQDAARGAARFTVRTDIRSANYSPNRMTPPHGIMIHHTAGHEGSDIPTLTRRGTGVSSNDYITKQGVIYELVSFDHAAWHGGPGGYAGIPQYRDISGANVHLWGIEFENYGNGRDPWPKAQIDAGVWRCRERLRFFRKNSRVFPDSGPLLIRHRDYQRGKTDTADNFPYAEFRRRVFAATDPTDDNPPETEPRPLPDPVVSPEHSRWGVEGGKVISPYNAYRPGADFQVRHKGEDVGAPTGAKVRAMTRGTVIRSRNGGVSGYNQEITVAYDVRGVSKYVEKIYVLYGHLLKDSLLPLGAHVEEGTVIGRVGTRADAANTPPHAHVQMWVSHKAALNYDNDAAQDPEPIRAAMGEPAFRAEPDPIVEPEPTPEPAPRPGHIEFSEYEERHIPEEWTLTLGGVPKARIKPYAVAEEPPESKPPATKIRDKDDLFGAPRAGLEQALALAKSRGAHPDRYPQAIRAIYNVPEPKSAWAPDVRTAQMLIETGNLNYGHDSRPWNLAGIKKGGIVGDEPIDFEVPKTPEAGAHMQANHGRAYGLKPAVAPAHARYSDAYAAQRSRGKPITKISELGGGIWATDPTYARKIRSLLDQMEAMSGQEEDVVKPEPPEWVNEPQPEPEPEPRPESPGRGPAMEPVAWGTIAKSVVLIATVIAAGYSVEVTPDLQDALVLVLTEILVALGAMGGIGAAERASVTPTKKLEGR